MTWHKRVGWRGTGGHESWITGEADDGYIKVKDKTNKQKKAESLISEVFLLLDISIFSFRMSFSIDYGLWLM